jgi:hypothetical protein
MAIPMALAMIFFHSVSPAEFYRYTDQNGIERYTDDLVQVPEDQRGEVRRYVEPDDHLTPEQRKKKAIGNSRDATAKDEKDAPVEDTDKKEIAQIKEIDEKKAQLDKEYKLLSHEKQVLASKKQAIKNQKDLRSYNIKADALNERIADFDKRNQLFKKELEQIRSEIGAP